MIGKIIKKYGINNKMKKKILITGITGFVGSHLADFILENKKNCDVFGISKDNLKSHDKFRAKFNVKFDLLADEDIVVLKKYKVWGKKKFMGREFMGIIRSTFLIDKKGKILKIWDNVKVKNHALEVLKTLTKIS